MGFVHKIFAKLMQIKRIAKEKSDFLGKPLLNGEFIILETTYNALGKSLRVKGWMPSAGEEGM